MLMPLTEFVVDLIAAWYAILVSTGRCMLGIPYHTDIALLCWMGIVSSAGTLNRLPCQAYRNCFNISPIQGLVTRWWTLDLDSSVWYYALLHPFQNSMVDIFHSLIWLTMLPFFNSHPKGNSMFRVESRQKATKSLKDLIKSGQEKEIWFSCLL